MSRGSRAGNLQGTFSRTSGPALADEVRADLQAFVTVFSTESPEWPSIIQALGLVLRPTPTPRDLLEAIINRYRLFTCLLI